MPDADRPIHERVRDAFFKHLAPPFAGLVASAIGGPVVGAGVSGVTAFLTERFTKYDERRRAERRIEEVADKAIDTLSEFIEAEWPSSSMSGALNPDAAASALARAVENGTSSGMFFEADLNTTTIADRVRGDAVRGLNDFETRLFDLALPKVIDAALAIVSQRRDFHRLAAREILIRLSDLDRQVPQLIRDNVNAALAARGADQHKEFEVRYRQALGRILNRMELLGLQQQGVEYPLEPAFVTLQLAGGRRVEPAKSANAMLDSLSSNRGRLLIVGEAGAGKSTLLQWAGVTAAYQRRRERGEEIVSSNVSRERVKFRFNPRGRENKFVRGLAEGALRGT